VIPYTATNDNKTLPYRTEDLRRIHGNQDLYTPFMAKASPAVGATEVTTIFAVCDAASFVDACHQPVGRQPGGIAIRQGFEVLPARYPDLVEFIVQTPGIPMATRRISRHPAAAP
jgi:hypothetical protein